MPKMKTHSGTKKRFRITGTGKVMREQAGKRHSREQVVRRARGASGTVEVSPRRRQEGQAAARSLSRIPDRPEHHPPAWTTWLRRRNARSNTQWHASRGQSTPTRSAGSTLERASGYRGQRSRLYRKAKEQVTHSLVYAYRDRRARKGDFRKLWIQRINAAARANGMTYNRLIQGLREGRVQVDRRMLADLAVNDPAAFIALVELREAALPADVNAQRERRGLSRVARPEQPRRGEPGLLTAPSARIKAGPAARRRAFRAQVRAFLAEGPQAVREALERRELRRRGVRRTDVADRHRDLRRSARLRRRPLVRPDPRRPIDGAVGHDHPARAWSPSASWSTYRWRRRTAEPRGWWRSAYRSATPATPARSIRTADAAGADAVVLTAESVDLYNPKCVRATSAACSTCRSPSAPTSPSRRRAWREPGLRVLAADGAGVRDLDDELDGGALAAPTAWLFGNEAGGCPTASTRSPTARCGSRSTAGPRASTSPRRPPSASTPRPAPNAVPDLGPQDLRRASRPSSRVSSPKANDSFITWAGSAVVRRRSDSCISGCSWTALACSSTSSVHTSMDARLLHRAADAESLDAAHSVEVYALALATGRLPAGAPGDCLRRHACSLNPPYWVRSGPTSLTTRWKATSALACPRTYAITAPSAWSMSLPVNPPALEKCETARADGDGVRTDARAGVDHLGNPRVPQHAGAKAVREQQRPGPPAGQFHARYVDLAVELVDGQFDQLVLGRHVPVEAGRTRRELGAELAHAQARRAPPGRAVRSPPARSAPGSGFPVPVRPVAAGSRSNPPGLPS